MTRVLLDAATLTHLRNLAEMLELCDERGRVLGYFHPLSNPADGTGEPARSPCSDEELRERRKQRTGRPLTEILDRFNRS